MKQKESRRGIIYYTKVLSRIIRLSVSKTHAYKAEVFANILRSLIVIIPQLVAIYALYRGNDKFAGWKMEESFLILGIFNLINYIAWSSFYVNLERLDKKIINGEWDFLMLKPISTVFSASFIDIFIYNLTLAVSGVVLIGYYLVKSESIFSIDLLSKSVLVFISGLLIWYSISLISASFSFRKPLNGAMPFSKQILNISRFPLDIWPSFIQIIFYTIIPIGFISTIPAKVITGKLSWEAVGMSMLISIFFLLLSNKIWNINISKYSSTGS